jgi:DNA-binding transcriptional MocR family regulator
MEIRIVRESPGPRRAVYLQIADQIRDAVSRGDLAQGARLPPIRSLATELGVNRDTVSLAYELLVREGLLEATVGRGTFVRLGQGSPTAGVRPPPPFAPLVERLLQLERARPSYNAVDGAVPLHALTPDPSLYPIDAFRKSLNRVLEESGSNLLAYGEHQGSIELRKTIAHRLSVQGFDIDAENVVLCQGASQGISLAMRLFAEPGDWVAVEEPTYHNVLAALVGLGLRPAPIPMGEQGPDLEILERTLARPEVKLFYTMPSFHNPLGKTTPASHRRSLIEVAKRVGKPIIEDGFEMDLRYAGEQVSPLAAFDSEGIVVHLFSFSKSLFPGVRIGAVTARGRAVDGLLALKNASDLSGAMILPAPRQAARHPPRAPQRHGRSARNGDAGGRPLDPPRRRLPALARITGGNRHPQSFRRSETRRRFVCAGLPVSPRRQAVERHAPDDGIGRQCGNSPGYRHPRRRGHASPAPCEAHGTGYKHSRLARISHQATPN